MRFGKLASSLRRWSRAVHREVSFFFAGLVVAYAVSGIAMNHRDTINPHYSVKRTEYSLPHSWPAGAKPDKDEVMRLLEPLGEEGNYTKHYFPKPGQMKVFLKSGSNLWVNMTEGTAVYLLITLTGVVMLKGTKGLWGRGGIELLVGIAVPVIWFLLA